MLLNGTIVALSAAQCAAYCHAVHGSLWAILRVQQLEHCCPVAVVSTGTAAAGLPLPPPAVQVCAGSDCRLTGSGTAPQALSGWRTHGSTDCRLPECSHLWGEGNRELPAAHVVRDCWIVIQLCVCVPTGFLHASLQHISMILMMSVPGCLYVFCLAYEQIHMQHVLEALFGSLSCPCLMGVHAMLDEMCRSTWLIIWKTSSSARHTLTAA